MKKKTRTARERPYDNTRRAEQASENRGRILDAARALMFEGIDELTVPAIAEQAGLSVPTVYRNFATREELLAAVDEHLTRSLGAPPVGSDVLTFAAALPGIHAYFKDNAETLRVVARRNALKDVIDAGRRQRDRQFEAMLQSRTGHLAAEETRTIAAALRILAGSEAFLTMHDRFGLDPAVSGRVVGWIVEHLVNDAISHRGPLTPGAPPLPPNSTPPRSDP